MHQIASLLFSNQSVMLLYLLIVLPVLFAVVCISLPRSKSSLASIIFLVGVGVNLLFSLILAFGSEYSVLIPWAGFEINLALRAYPFSVFMLMFTAVLVFLLGFYSVSYFKGYRSPGLFFFLYLLAVAFTNGGFLANNLVVMLFFWSGMLTVLLIITLIAKMKDGSRAHKSVGMNTLADLLFLFGIGIVSMEFGSSTLDTIRNLEQSGWGLIGYIFLFIGAAGRLGVIPFHSWLSDMSQDSPIPMSTLIINVLNRMLSVYFLTRLTLEFYAPESNSAFSVVLQAVAAATILLCALMAWVQKDMMRTLAFHSSVQAGFILFGFACGTPESITAGFFFAIASVLAQCGLFMTAGAVKHRTGTTNMRHLSGIGRKMPLTGASFLLCALSSIGMIPFAGFFAREFVMQAAYSSNVIFYVIILLGVLAQCGSLLKLGHSVFFGSQIRLPSKISSEDILEAPGAMLISMGLIGVSTLVLGLWRLPVQNLLKIQFAELYFINICGWPLSLLALISASVVLLALLHHFISYRVTGSALKVADHIYYLPGLHHLFVGAENHLFDPYEILQTLFMIISWFCYCISRATNWIFYTLIMRMIHFITLSLRNFNTGTVSSYLSWAFAGIALIALLVILI